MSVTEQVYFKNSPLNTFLNQYLPLRHQFAQEWAWQLTAVPETAPIDPTIASTVGKAAEIRIGLDLADRLVHEKALRALHPNSCRFLLEACGFSRDPSLDDPATIDPLLQAWTRIDRPSEINARQRAALNVCYEAASFEALTHRLGNISVSECREMHKRLGSRGNRDGENELSEIWRIYTQLGRTALTELGSPVIISPLLAPGFAEADLICGNTLIDIKAQQRPMNNIEVAFDQVLAYALTDRLNVYDIKAIGAYYARQGIFVATSLNKLLTNASDNRHTPDNLRQAFSTAMKESLDNGEYWYRMRQLNGM